MTSPFDLDAFIKHLKVLRKLRRRHELLAEIKRAEEMGSQVSPVLRLKYMAQAVLGDIEGAYATLHQLMPREDSGIGDFYWAGEHATELGHYEDAETFLSRAIRRAKDTNDHYYLECAVLLRAYVRVFLRKFALAQEDINELDDDADITWNDRLGIITKRGVLAQLADVD